MRDGILPHSSEGYADDLHAALPGGQRAVNGFAFAFQLLAHLFGHFLVAFRHFHDLQLAGFDEGYQCAVVVLVEVVAQGDDTPATQRQVVPASGRGLAKP